MCFHCPIIAEVIFILKANKTAPEFSTKYKSTEQLIKIQFTILIVRLHQEGLTELIQFANNFQQKMEQITNKAATGKDRIADAGPPLATIDEGDEEEQDETKKVADEAEKAPNRLSRSASKKTVPVVDSIKVKVVAEMEQVAIELISLKRPITNLKV